jgi:predicted nucleic acid-binding Zn ribbon protein
MQKRGPKSVAGFLPHYLLKQMNAFADDSARLNTLWRQCVEGPLAEAAKPYSLKRGVLEVHVTSSAWANRLRHFQGELLKTLRRDSGEPELRELRIRVVPGVATSGAQPAVLKRRSPSRLPREARRMFAELAVNVADPELAKALTRLGSDDNNK